MKTVILTIAGIGTKKAGYSAEFEENLRKINKSEIEVIECLPFATTGIDANQEALFNRLDAENNLGGILSLRKFVLEAFGDAATFSQDSPFVGSPYQEIHLELCESIRKANKILNEGDTFIILAASMGVHLVSTYIWDADNEKGLFENFYAFKSENLRNLDKLVSIGCNIPLFVSGLDESQIIPFEKRNDTFTWDNFYDKDDVLGYPLKQMSKPYGELVNDHQINVGLYAGSHVRYWGSKKFAKAFNELIK